MIRNLSFVCKLNGVGCFLQKYLIALHSHSEETLLKNNYYYLVILINYYYPTFWFGLYVITNLI